MVVLSVILMPFHDPDVFLMVGLDEAHILSFNVNVAEEVYVRCDGQDDPDEL